MASTVDALPSISDRSHALLKAFERVTVALGPGYAARLLTAARPVRFATSFFGVVDLVAILLFYLATGLDLRAVRAIRLFRLTRPFKLLGCSRAVARVVVAHRDYAGGA